MSAGMEAKRLRHPLIPIAVAIGSGIIVDRTWSPSFVALICLAAVSTAAWLFATWRRSDRRVTAGLLFCWVICLGAARHHLFWSTAESDDVFAFAGEEPRLVRLVGTLVDQPQVITPPIRASRSVWAQHDSTAATLACLSVVSSGRELPVTGRAALRVIGRLPDVNVGDEIEVCGWLARPQPRAIRAPSTRRNFIDGRESAAWSPPSILKPFAGFTKDRSRSRVLRPGCGTACSPDSIATCRIAMRPSRPP